jgi:hypothetical protein
MLLSLVYVQTAPAPDPVPAEPRPARPVPTARKQAPVAGRARDARVPAACR